MNALAVIERAAVPADFTAWLSTGRTLLAERNAIDWRLADWMATGRETFGDQAAFDFLADELGIAPKALKSAVKVATAFPPHMRAAGLSFDVHKEIARVEPEQRLLLLTEAQRGRWNEKAAHEHVEEWRINCGARMDDDDPEHAEVAEVVRAYNRLSSPEVREYLWPYLQHSARHGFGPINMGVTIDA